MAEQVMENIDALINTQQLSQGEREELIALGFLSKSGELLPPSSAISEAGPGSVPKSAIRSNSVLNEAPEYGAAFSRGLRIEMSDHSLLFISGTASVDQEGFSIHRGDIRAQCWRTYRNISSLLESEGATWKDVVKTTCYLRDIERDYDEFNSVRTAFFDWYGLNPLPASVGIQARLCREDLLVEIEAIALLKKS